MLWTIQPFLYQVEFSQLFLFLAIHRQASCGCSGELWPVAKLFWTTVMTSTGLNENAAAPLWHRGPTCLVQYKTTYRKTRRVSTEIFLRDPYINLYTQNLPGLAIDSAGPARPYIGTQMVRMPGVAAKRGPLDRWDM